MTDLLLCGYMTCAIPPPFSISILNEKSVEQGMLMIHDSH